MAKSISIILTQDISKLGSKGETVHVRGGYFRNYLFPRRQAVLANSSNLSMIREQERIKELKKKRERAKADEAARRLSKITLMVKAKAGEGGKLFGAVTAVEIAKSLEAKGFEIDHRKIELQEPIRTLGQFAVKVHLHPEVEILLKLSVIS